MQKASNDFAESLESRVADVIDEFTQRLNRGETPAVSGGFVLSDMVAFRLVMHWASGWYPTHFRVSAPVRCESIG